MKLNICYSAQQQITNYTNLVLEENGIDLNTIVNSSCEEIVVSSVLDHLTYENANKALREILGKLRLGGTITITGIDAKALSRLVLSESVSIEQFNEILGNTKSFNTIFNVRNILTKIGLVIESDFINGYSYSITAKRNKV